MGDASPSNGPSPSSSPPPPLYVLSFCMDRVLVLLDMTQASKLPEVVGVVVLVRGTFRGLGELPMGFPCNCTAATPLTDELLNITSLIFQVCGF